MNLFPEKMHFHMFPVASLQAKGAVITLKMTFDLVSGKYLIDNHTIYFFLQPEVSPPDGC